MNHWKVLFVKPRVEKKIAEYCTIYSIPFYLPLKEKNRLAQRRLVRVREPLFPGYVFARVTQPHRLLLLKTNLLVRILDPSHPKTMLRDLVMVRKALRADPSLQPTKVLPQGRWVRITKGPFAGVEGKISRMSGTLKVVLNVDMIGQAVSILAETDSVETIGRA